jgi:Lysyl oxidase
MFKFLFLIQLEMGVNLIPKMDGYRISRENFKPKEEGGDGSVNLGCVDKGNHRVLRFNLHTINIGDKDLVIGNPKDRPDIFEHSDVFPTGFQFRRPPFFVYKLKNDDSSVNISGYKIPFCFDALHPMSCENQGIAARGGEDIYESELQCQFVVIDDLADGEYILEATVNAPAVDAGKYGKGKVLFEEDNYDDNTIAVRLQIKGDNIQELSRK